MMDAWKCPKGWRVKGDSEICESGDVYSHSVGGEPHRYGFAEVRENVGKTVLITRRRVMENGGFILSKTPAPPAPPNDTCLAWLAGKITAAMKEFPEDADAIRMDWLAGKASLAKSMIGKIEDVRAKRKGGAT